MFIFKKSKIVLDCFTFDESIIKTMPIDFANKHFPEWWKKLPKSYKPNNQFFESATMKTCAGMVDYYKNSICIPLWSELCIKIENGRYVWQFADKRTKAIVHEQEQRQGFMPSNQFGHMKIDSPWMFKTKESLNWVWSQPFYSFENPSALFVLPGVVNYSEVCITHINLGIPLDKNRTINLDFGQSMVHITPMTDKEIEIRRHLISEKEFNEMYFYESRKTFLNSYQTMKNFKNKYSKCPFSNEK